MSNLSNISTDLAAIVASVGQYVVRIEARGRFPASGIIWPSPEGKGGLIVTAHHVITDEENIHVGLANGSRSEAKLAGQDPTTDLALLRVDEKLESAPNWIGPENLQVGHLVLALARPGRTVRAALGMMSAVSESWRTAGGGIVDRYLQADLEMYPGFSGGPSVSAEGNIVGINTSALMRGAAITIPEPTVKRVAEELLARGRISRGYLGVGIQPARLPSEVARELSQEIGLLVISVEPGSPAGKAGLVLGDTIVTLSGKRLSDWDALTAALGKDQIGKPATLKIVRAGKVLELPATIGEHP